MSARYHIVKCSDVLSLVSMVSPLPLSLGTRLTLCCPSKRFLTISIFYLIIKSCFSLFFSVEIAKCTEERTSAHLFSRGYFTSPTYPSKYPPSRVCSWTLQAPPGHFMKVTFDAFQTQCPNDKVTVRDNDQNGQLLGEFCGGQKPPVFRGGKLWVRFTSDNDIILSAERGFNATYEALPCKCYLSGRVN